MSGNPLKIVETDSAKRAAPASDGFTRHEVKAKFERMWLEDPEQFNPERDCLNRDRIERAIKMIDRHVPLKGKRVCDLGCGYGALSLFALGKGAEVDSIDIATNALKRLEHTGVETVQDFIPTTGLRDSYYDLVICTDVIAYLPAKAYRHFFAELARVVKSDGYVLCSTDIDFSTVGAVQRFGDLAETEFTVHEWEFSYNKLFIIIRGWLPGALLGWFNNNVRLMRSFARISSFLWYETGISHALFIGKRRPLFTETSPELQPQERLGKKEVWE